MAESQQKLEELEGALSQSQKQEYLKLKRKRKYPKGRITYFNNLLNTSPTPTIGLLKTVKDELPIIQEKFNAVQDLLDDQFGDLEELYNERESFDKNLFELKLKVESLQAVVNSATYAPLADTPNMSARLQLPSTQLPKFNGERKNWLSWHKLFTSMIGDRVDLDDINKYHYLQLACMEGQASHIVNSTADSSYRTAISKLEERYDNDVQLKLQLVNELYNIQAPESKSSKDLFNFVARLESCLSFLNSVDINTDNWALLLLCHLSTKLDLDTRKELERQKKPDEFMTMQQFLCFLRARAQLLEAEAEMVFKPKVASTPNRQDSFVKKGNNSKNLSFPATSTQNDKSKAGRSCPFCEYEHDSFFKCIKVKSLTETQRFLKVREAGLCYNCLRAGHSANECTASKCQKCGQNHHTILHRTKPLNDNSGKLPEQKKDETVDKEQPQASKEVAGAAVGAEKKLEIVVLATAIIYIENSYGIKFPCRAFLDSGSTVCFITEHMTQLLELKKEEVNIAVGGINNQDSCNRYKVTTTVGSRVDNQYKATLDFLVTKKITSDLPTVKIDTTGWNLPIDNELADPGFAIPNRIDVLLGAEVFFDIMLGQKQKLGNALWMYSSKLGQLIVGKINQGEGKQYSFVTIRELKESIQRFWETEAVDNKYCYTMEEKAAEKHYLENVKQLPNGHYEVALPFNNLIDQLGDSSLSAKRIYMFAERRLERQPERKIEYDKFIREMLDMNHLELAPLEPQGRIYYMTHHMISRPLSTTTKYRVVFNASHPTNTGISLNQTLMVGPTIQNEIFIHLFRWRQYAIGLISDAEKMYRQVYVKEKDRDVQRIWYRFDKSLPLQSYRVTRVTYGTASAPFLATRTLKQLADDQILNYPDVVPYLANNIYVDDYTSSHDNVQAAAINKTRLMQLAQEGGFTFRKWTSNEVTLDDNPEILITTVLGVTWNKKDDTIVLSFDHVKMTPVITKSTVLSEIASMFDPLGLCAPVVIRAKMFMQKLWSYTQCNWDEPLPSELSEEWLQFRQQLNEMQQITIPRNLITDKSLGITLHGFCDASKDGYGACIYVVNGNLSRLICAKSRVAPIKPMTIPRLELCSAVLLSKLMSKIIPTFECSINGIFNWSDSEINVFRIKNAASKFNVYVGTRIGDIQEKTNPLSWQHLKSADNPADYVSRGIAPTELKNLSMWWHGPPFILKDPKTWPSQTKFDIVNKEMELELKKQVTLIAVSRFLDDCIQKMSSYKIAKRAIANCLRFASNSKKKLPQRNFDPITAEEIYEAEIRLIKIAQQESFCEELKFLRKKMTITSASSKIFNLNPFLDDQQLIRVGGRLSQSNFEYNQKHQVIIPNGRLAKLLLRHLHEENLHCGPQMLLSTSRQRYWIIGARSLCRSIVQNCVICFKNKPVLMQQLMGDLPKARLTTPYHPFMNVGIDFAGPFFIRPQPRSKVVQKTYVAVFTCFVTRGVHLEVVPNLSTSAFLQCFRRFLARRGLPTYISTDNATNFIGARSELKELKEMFFSERNMNEFKHFCAEKNIKWLTIPARSPHWGGLWESIVKQMKFHLRRATKEKIFAPDDFSTLIIQIEAALNSRPLTQISSNVDDLNVITPGHFLIGRPLNTLPEPDYCDVPENRLTHWQQMQKLRAQIWQRFQNDYFHELQTRAKWRKEFPDIKIGTIVLIHEDNVPPNFWKLGRVQEIYHGTDNHVRAVLLKTSEGTLKRSIVKIAPLPINDD